MPPSTQDCCFHLLLTLIYSSQGETLSILMPCSSLIPFDLRLFSQTAIRQCRFLFFPLLLVIIESSPSLRERCSGINSSQIQNRERLKRVEAYDDLMHWLSEEYCQLYFLLIQTLT